MRSKYSYLKPFVGDWATKECLRDHLSGKRSYRRCNGAVEEDDSSDFGNIIIGSEPDDDDECHGLPRLPNPFPSISVFSFRFRP